MGNFESQFQNSDFYKQLSIIEGSSKGKLYSSREISREENKDSGFEDRVLQDKLSQELIDIAGDLETSEEKKEFLKLLSQYKGKLNSRYLYNVRGRTLLLKLEEAGLSQSGFDKFLKIADETTSELGELVGDLGESFKYYTEKGFESTSDSFVYLKDIFTSFKKAGREEKLGMIMELSASGIYESLEPSKKLKVLSLFVPDTLLKFIIKSTSKFDVNGVELHTGEIINSFVGLIEDGQGVLDFLEIDTKKYFNYDIELFT